jgi:CxxC motif-containing protein
MTEEIKKLICIACPKGCTLDLTMSGETILKVENASCKNGYEYAEKETTDPRRMVASTVKVKGGVHPLVPVYTERAIPKRQIQDLLKELRKVEIPAPVEMGQVIISDVLGTGIPVIASRSLPKGM